MVGAAVVALRLLVSGVREARAAGDLDASAALTLGIGWLVSMPIALVAIFGGLQRRPDVFGDLVASYPNWYPAPLAFGLAGVLAAGLLFRQLTAARVSVQTAGLFAILLCSVAQLSSGINGGPLLTMRGGVLLLCLMAATVLKPGRGAALGAGIYGVTLAIVSGLLTLWQPDVAFVRPCTGACGGLGLSGVLSNPDLLGVGLAASIPFTYLGFRGHARTWLSIYVAMMVIATGSLTASAAAVVALGGLLVVRPRLDAVQRTPGRTALATLALLGAVIGSVAILQHSWNPEDLSGRPALWQVASDHIRESSMLGHGAGSWERLYTTSEIPLAAQRSAHNQWLDVLFAAGWVGAALLIAVAAAMIWSAGAARSGVLVALTTIIVIGTAEGTWSIATVDGLSYSLVALILTGPSGRHRVAPGSNAARQARVQRDPPPFEPVPITATWTR